MKKLLLTLVLQGLSGGILLAQSIKAEVREQSTQEPIEFATVLLKKTSDSSLVKSAFTDSLGVFELAAPQGNYFLQVQFVGYETVNQGPLELQQQVLNLGTLWMNQNTKMLNEVTVKGERPAVERQAGKTVLNIASNSIYKTSTNVLDVLAKAPGIRVSGEGALSLGNNITPKVFIDGKDIPMDATELNNYLSTLNPDLVESIEIITSPSSKYEAKYRAIINIKLKRDKQLGWSGNYMIGYRQHRYGELGNHLNTSYRAKKFALNTNMGWVESKGFYTYDGVQTLGDGGELDTYTDVVVRTRVVPFSLGTDYFFNKNHSAGIQYRGMERNATRNNTTDNAIHYAESSRLQETHQNSKPYINSHTGNAYYNGKFKQSTIDFLATSAHYKNLEFQNIITDELPNWREHIRSNSDSKIDINSSQIDFKTPGLKGTWEMGAKVAHTKTDNDILFDIWNEKEFEVDPKRTNHFIYKEGILAGYAQYAAEKKQWNYQLGLRLENTQSEGQSLADNSITKRNYTQWMPSALLAYQFKNEQSVQLAYNSKIRRPNFEELNPFQFYVSQFTYSEGNPFLLPEKTDQLELSYSIKNYGFTLRSGLTKDPIRQIPYYNPENNMTRYFHENVTKYQFNQLDANGSNRINSWWNVQYYAQVGLENNYYKVGGKAYDRYVLSSNVGGTQVFKLKNDWILTHTIYYFLGGGDALYDELLFGQFSLGLQKKFAKSNWVMKLNADDIFNTGNPRIKSIRPEVIQTKFTQYYGTQKVKIQLVYNFGKSTYKAKQTRKTEEESRVE